MQTEPYDPAQDFYCIQCWAMFAEECACNDDDEDDSYDDEPFTLCADCDGHPACLEFGCAIKLGLSHMVNKDPGNDF